MSLARKSLRASMQLIGIVLMLAAQHSALTHPFAHLQNEAAVKLQQRGDDRSRLAHSALCDYHGALAEVLGCVASAPAASRLASNGAEREAGSSAAASPVSTVTAAARGPPVLI